MMDEMEVAVCPFCGSDEVRYVYVPLGMREAASHGQAIVCNGCGAKGPSDRDGYHALVRWNIRDDDDGRD